MDRVRFGRALGYGARHVGKAVAQAVEAATTPDPVKPMAEQTTAMTNAKDAKEERQGRGGTRQAVHTAGRSFFGPLAKFSKSLWLEVTGSFFLLVALFLGSAAWKQRGAISLPPAAHEAQKLYVCLVMFAAFAYFAASSFVRAGRVNRAGR